MLLLLKHSKEGSGKRGRERGREEGKNRLLPVGHSMESEEPNCGFSMPKGSKTSHVDTDRG